jgi:parallel beta-helix repeat protein
MKTLDQVQPRIIVNSTNTPGNSSNQFIISQSGSYYFAGNLTGVSGKNGILINAVNVSLDLNGFQMLGVSGSLAAITDGGNNNGNVRIHNGTIRAWGGAGLELSHSFDSIISDLIAADCGGIGIDAGDGFVLRDCMARNNTGDNIKTGFNATVFHCTAAASVTGDGINLGQDSTLANCAANFNGAYGILTSVACHVSHSTASDNSGGGIAIDSYTTLISCTASRNVAISGRGISAGAGCTLVNCTASQNTVQYGIVAGTGSTVANCTASYNTSAQNNSAGIFVSDSTVEGCTAFSNATTAGTTSHLTGVGINAGGFSTVRHCTASVNGGSGIYVNGYSLVQDNLVYSGAFNGGGGIEVNSTDSRIEGNQVVSSSAAGILVTGTGNLIIRNSARDNSPNYSIVASNRYGDVQDDTASGSAAVSGNSAAGVLGTNSPWANIAY